MNQEPPDGYRYEWQADPRWKCDPGVRNCRQSHCGKPAEAALNRGSTDQPKWWYYCEDHLYGRRIQNGQVEWPVLVSNELKRQS